MIALSKQTETITLDYHLHDLPTAQHKAGLAGLILMIRSMEARKLHPAPRIRELSESMARIELQRESLQKLFDDLYDAAYIERKSKTKRSSGTPIRIIEEIDDKTQNGGLQRHRSYVYRDVEPLGNFLQALLPPGGQIWIKLWREMLWQTLRGIPKTREVYENRAKGLPLQISERTWNSMLASLKSSAKGIRKTESIASSVFIGAQAFTAERVPFLGTVEENFLLHFWTLASLTFVPRVVRSDGDLEDVGYVIAVPEAGALKTFTQDAEELLGSLESDASGYRPRFSLIHITGEAALEYLYHLARNKVKEEELSWSLTAIELYHLEKRGKNVRLLGSERVLPEAVDLAEYELIRETFRNPLFRARRMGNLLFGEPWHAHMDSLFSQFPIDFFVFQGHNPISSPGFFGQDAKRTFDVLLRNLSTEGGTKDMSAQDNSDELAVHVYKLIRTYVNRRTEEKSGKKYQDFKGDRDKNGRILYPREYRESRGKVCSDAFLATRGRRDRDFVEYFTGTICSVPQYLPEADYLAVSRALMTDWQTVKTLTMLALSAQSYLPKTATDGEEGGEE